MADTQEAMELLPTEATHAESESGETQDDVNGDEAPEEDARAQDETAEAETQQEAESEPQADADAEQPTDDQAESEAPAGDTQETAEAQADEAGTEEPMPDVTEAEAEADAEAAGDAEGRTALADQAVEEDQGPPEHRKLREAIRAIMAASDMDKLTASEIRKKLKPSFDKKYIKEQKSYIKQFVLDEIKKLQDEGGGAEDEAEEAPDNEAEGEYEGIQDQGMEDDNDSDYEKPAPRSSKKDSKARKRKLKRSSNDDDDEDDDGKPSKRRKKSTKDVKIQGPAGPKPAYFIFAAEHRDALREEYPDVSVKDLNSKLSERWKQISTSEKAEYEKKAKQDQQRYAAEMRAFKESNPEQHDLFIKQKNEAKSRKGKKKGSGDESGESGDEGGGNKDKNLSYVDSILNDLKSRRQKANNDEKTNQENCKKFVDRMGSAADNDLELHESKQPALNKLKMLDDVMAICSRVRMHEFLMNAGLLKAIRVWLQPLDEGSVLPNIKIRTSLYKILDGLPVNDLYLHNSDSLGKLMMELWKHRDETPENKKIIAQILEKWMRPIARTETNYKHLAKYEEQRAYEIRERRELMAKKQPLPYLNSKRARIPEQATFDYAIRPQAAVHNRDREEMQEDEDSAKAAAIKARDESRRGQLMKKLDNSRKRSAGKTNFKVDIEGRRMAL